MVDLNVQIPEDTYSRIYAAKGKTRRPIRELVLEWIESGLAGIGLPADPKTPSSDKSVKGKK